MNQLNIVDSAAQFIVKIEDTDDGFCLQLTDTKTNVINELFKSTSFSLVEDVFTELLENIDPGWFRLTDIIKGAGKTKAIFYPIQQYSPSRGL